MKLPPVVLLPGTAPQHAGAESGTGESNPASTGPTHAYLRRTGATRTKKPAARRSAAGAAAHGGLLFYYTGHPGGFRRKPARVVSASDLLSWTPRRLVWQGRGRGTIRVAVRKPGPRPVYSLFGKPSPSRLGRWSAQGAAGRTANMNW